MKKTLHVIENILVWLLVIAAVGMMVFTVISVATFDSNHRTFFGYHMFIVRSDSMKATDFEAGDLIFVKNTDPATLSEGDIVAYISQNSENFGETVTHKIRKCTTDEEGNEGFITYGTTTGHDDDTVVTYPYVLGKYTGRIPGVGRFFMFMKTTPGYILCIFLPFFLLIISQTVRCVKLFRQYRLEQREEIQSEKDQLDQQRKENEEMMKQIQQMRAQMDMTLKTHPEGESAPSAEKPEETAAL